MLRKPGEYDPSKRVQVSARRKTAEVPDDVVRKLSRLPANKKCADCSAKLPQAVNLTHGTFVCLACSGVHREFSHRVKGIGASSFLPEEAEFLTQNGNEKVNNLYLANYHPASERIKEPDGSVSTVDGHLLREWLRRKYIDRSFMGTGHQRTGSATTHTNTGPTRVHIPPKQSVAKTSVAAPTADLLGGWDTNDASPPTTTNSSTDAEWDAFGQSRVQQHSFHADFGSQNPSHANMFHADFSQADISKMSSIPTEPQQPPPPPPNDFHADFNQFGVSSTPPLSVPKEVQQPFQPDFSSFQANPPPLQMDHQEGMQNAFQSPPFTTHISQDIPSLQIQQPSMEHQTIQPNLSVPMNQDISNTQMNHQEQLTQSDLYQPVNKENPPLQQNHYASSNSQLLQNQEISTPQMNAHFVSGQGHEDFSSPQLQDPTFHIQMAMPSMVSESNLNIPSSAPSHQQPFQQQEMTVQPGQSNQDILSPQIQQLTLQQESALPAMSTKVDLDIPSPQMLRHHQQQSLSQSNFGEEPHDNSIDGQFTSIHTFHGHQLQNQATPSYGQTDSKSLSSHGNQCIPSQTGSAQSASVSLSENPMQMTESSNGIPPDHDGANPVQSNVTSSASVIMDNSNTFNSFGNMTMSDHPIHPTALNSNSVSLDYVEQKSSNSSNVNFAREKYQVGQKVVYKSGETVTVIKVHLDDDLVPFYDIRFQDGKEKQTTHEHLTADEESLYNTNSKGTLIQSIIRILHQLNEDQLASTEQFLVSNFSLS